MRQGRSKEYAKGTRRHRWTGRFPIRRFLFSRLGQSWDQVHSELSQEFDRRTYSGNLFWKHGLWDLEENCWIGAETGKIYDGHDMEVSGFYVHPFTGILSFTPGSPRPEKDPKPIVRIVIDDRYSYEKIDGIWYHTEYTVNEVRRPTYSQYYLFPWKGYTVIEQSKKQLNKDQLRDLGVSNEDPEKCLELKQERKEAEKKMYQSFTSATSAGS